jgi:hypothetical protein
MTDDHKEKSTDRSRAPAPASTRADIDAFLAKVKGLASTTNRVAAGASSSRSMPP